MKNRKQTKTASRLTVEEQVSLLNQYTETAKRALKVGQELDEAIGAWEENQGTGHAEKICYKLCYKLNNEITSMWQELDEMQVKLTAAGVPHIPFRSIWERLNELSHADEYAGTFDDTRA